MNAVTIKDLTKLIAEDEELIAAKKIGDSETNLGDDQYCIVLIIDMTKLDRYPVIVGGPLWVKLNDRVVEFISPSQEPGTTLAICIR